VAPRFFLGFSGYHGHLDHGFAGLQVPFICLNGLLNSDETEHFQGYGGACLKVEKAIRFVVLLLCGTVKEAVVPTGR